MTLRRSAITGALHRSDTHVLMADLFKSDPSSITRLLRFPTNGAGRPRDDEFYFVSLIEYVMRTKGFDQANDAIDWLKDHQNDLDLPENYLPVAKTLRNKHAALGTFFRLWSRSMYVSPGLLTLLPPLPPGAEHDAEMAERCRYPPTDGSPWPYGVVIEIRQPKK